MAYDDSLVLAIFDEYAMENNMSEAEAKELKGKLKSIIRIDDCIHKEIIRKKDCVAYRIEPHCCINPNNNKKEGICSHTVANNHIKNIANNEGKVLALKVGFRSLLENAHPNALELIHTNEASIFCGFCNDKGSCEESFNDIDNLNNFPLKKEDYYKFFYRDLGKRIVCMESSLKIREQYSSQLTSLENFFGHKIKDFNWKKQLNDITIALLESKANFMHWHNICYNDVLKNQVGRFEEFKTIQYEMSFEGFVIGTLTQAVPSLKNNLLVNDYVHCNFWIDKDKKQNLQILYQKHNTHTNLSEIFTPSNKIINFKKALVYSFINQFPNVYFSPNHSSIDVKKIMSQIYDSQLFHNSSKDKIEHFIFNSHFFKGIK